MEALAYIHCCAAYDEAEGIEYDFPKWEFNWKLPSSAWIGILATVTALSILGTTSGAFAIRSGRYYVGSSRLNVRSCPGGCVVKTLGYGRAVYLTGATSGSWAQTASGNWVHASLLTSRSRVRDHGCYRWVRYRDRDRYHSRYHRPYYSRSVLDLGSRGNSVSHVQQSLRRRGYHVRVDGVYGNQTYNAIREFQRDNYLSVDGKVGSRTKRHLYYSS